MNTSICPAEFPYEHISPQPEDYISHVQTLWGDACYSVLLPFKTEPKHFSFTKYGLTLMLYPRLSKCTRPPSMINAHGFSGAGDYEGATTLALGG